MAYIWKCQTNLLNREAAKKSFKDVAYDLVVWAKAKSLLAVVYKEVSTKAGLDWTQEEEKES